MYPYLSYNSKRKTPTASWEDNIKTDSTETRWMCVGEGFIWVRIRTKEDSSEHSNELSGSIICRNNNNNNNNNTNNNNNNNNYNECGT